MTNGLNGAAHPLPFTYNDGGRALAGFKGSTRDCGCRAVAIATGRDYREVYSFLNRMSKVEHLPRGWNKSHSRTGVHAITMHKYLKALDFKWTSCVYQDNDRFMCINKDDLPMGRLVLYMHRHFAAVINHVLYDTWNSGSGRYYQLKGYWKLEENWLI